ncbi:hypothetical protein CIJ84_12615 [Neisseria meningitidis]|uniref:PilS cassette n=1 Tax=Neisseria meningitidis TaxID=487 RepID=A0AB37K5C6_NEIME|nr:hypothetical protein [Neisseria meningitidis]MBG9011386.1 hypothetical protein [Neisseria meningitidis]MBG9065776.1 hypothetical protein [Neisseria meningitidis]MBG9077862.1 hypothetical protein [Neisseria meningitidis]MBG9132163.1 hypothetical protein [Neisseria meningitidis]
MPSESHFRRSDGIFSSFVYKPLKSLYTQNPFNIKQTPL